MFCSNNSGKEKNESDDESDKPYPRGKVAYPVTPKMLIRTLKKLKKNSFKGVTFTPEEVSNEIRRMYPNIEQDRHILLLEVSDKLMCAAAAGLVGSGRNSGYFAFDHKQGESIISSGSELMFWLFYKRILKNKAEGKKYRNEADLNYVQKKREKNTANKVVRLMSFNGNHLQLVPVVPYRNKMLQKP